MKVSDYKKNYSKQHHSSMKVDRRNKFESCYYGQLNSLKKNHATLRPRYTRGFLTRVSRLFGQSSLKQPSFGEDAGYPAMLVFSPASRVLLPASQSAVSVALVAVERGGWVC